MPLRRSCFVLLALVLAGSPAGAQTLTVDGSNSPYRLRGVVRAYQTVVVKSGGKIAVEYPYDSSCPDYPDRTKCGNLEIIAASITVEAGGVIDATGLGYQPRLCDNGAGPAAGVGGRGGC
ncbi:MAG TPA: hypothetical protein VGQ83_07910, partial [Polyangia bacterium]